MKKIKIAVLGSCVTRDVFNSMFNSNYKDFYEVSLTQNQTSIISLMSDPIPYREEKLDNIKIHEIVDVKSELDKSFLKLIKEKSPDYLIIDFFGDIHFGALKLGDNHYLTNNRWKLLRTSFYKELQELNLLQIDKDPKEYFNLWKSYVDGLFMFLKKEVPKTKVIINKARNVDIFMDEENVKRKMSTSGNITVIDVPYFNQLWEMLDNYVIENYKTDFIYLHDKEYISFSGHPWGRFYVHYTMEFYADFLNKLHQIVIGDLQKSLQKTKRSKKNLQELVANYESESLTLYIKRNLLKINLIRNRRRVTTKKSK